MRPGRWWVVALALPFCGCPIGSDVPLGPPTRSLHDSRLVGKWRCIGSNDDPPGYLEFRPIDDARYAVSLSPCGKNDDACEFRGHITKVRRVSILNIEDVAADKRPWAFVKYALYGPNVLHIQVLQGGNVDTAAEAQDAVRQALKEADSDEDLLVCVRRARADENAPDPAATEAPKAKE
jgi:hypothetical protein